MNIATGFETTIFAFTSTLKQGAPNGALYAIQNIQT